MFARDNLIVVTQLTYSLKMKKICLIEDSSDLRKMVKDELSAWYELYTYSTIATAESELARREFELMLIDICLPDGSGFEFAAKLKLTERYKKIPVIFLTSIASPQNKSRGASIEANHEVVKPFDLHKLRSRMESVLRKNANPTMRESVTYFGPFMFDHLRMKAYLNVKDGAHVNRDLMLDASEFKLLSFLAAGRERFFSRAEISVAVWGSDSGVHENVIYTRVAALRRKLGKFSFVLESVPKVGYRMVLPQGNQEPTREA